MTSLLYLTICLTAWTITTADDYFAPKAEDVHWVSLDFKTILKWTTKPSDHTYTVLYSQDDRDWNQSPDCIGISESECDLTNYLEPLNRTYSADIQTEPRSDYDNFDELPHTYSRPFNPYKESNISAVKFTVEVRDGSRVIINITDPLTSIHRHGKQLSIKDILKSDLKYKIIYYKSGSTGKRDVTSNSSVAEVSKLDAGQSYCFMVAAFVPSRHKTTQLGAWSVQLCTLRDSQELSLGAWVGAIFILLIVLIIIVTVTVLCCRCCRQKTKSLHAAQQSSSAI